MAKYSLGKNVGTTDRTTQQRVAPRAGEDKALAFRGTPGEVKKIRKPEVVIQRWQGDTYVSNPAPTLAPKLDLPELRNVIAEPNRDFARLADALGTFNKQLVNFGTVQTEYEGQMQKAARDEADAIIKQTSVDGTANQKLGNLTAELERVIKDENSSEDDKDYARRTLDRIKADSRLKPAIESAYREEAVLNKAYSLDSAAKTESITRTEVVDGEEVEVQVPIHTLSPNDPDYLKWANNYLFGSETKRLTSFEYRNVKGTLAQVLANNRSAQSKLYNAHLDAEYVDHFNRTTNEIGSQLKNGDITNEQAAFKIHQLLDRGRYGTVSGTIRKQLDENLIENITVGYIKDNPGATPDDLEPLFNMLMTGPVESRVLKKERKVTITTESQAEQYFKDTGKKVEIGDEIVEEYGVLNDKQKWLGQFPEGYMEQRIRDANAKLAQDDENAQRAANGIEDANFQTIFTNDIFPLLAGEKENLSMARKLLEEKRAEALSNANGDGIKINAINKAYDKGLNTLYGVFAHDYNTDKAKLEDAKRDALMDQTKIGNFALQLDLFTRTYKHYPKAQTYITNQAFQYERLFTKLEEQQLEPIKGLLKAGKEYYVKVVGKGHESSKGGHSNVEEMAEWSIVEGRILDAYYAGIEPGMSDKELREYSEDFIDKFVKDRKAFMKKFLYPDPTTASKEETKVIQPSYEGNVKDSLNTWEQTAIKTSEINTDTGLLNDQGRTRLRLLYESDTPMFSKQMLDEIPKRIIKKGEMDKRLKVIVNNLPGSAAGKIGDFLINQYEKNGIDLTEDDINKLRSLNGIKISDARDNSGRSNPWIAFVSNSQGTLVASTDLSGVLQGVPPLPSIPEETDPLKQPKALENLIIEMNGAFQFRGASNPNYQKGDYRSNKKGNWFFDYKPHLIQGAIERIDTLTEQDLNAMTIGALLEAGSTDLEKFEVGANLLIRSVHYGNIPIAEVLAMPNQYEAIFNPMGRVPGLKPYTAEDLAGTPDFIKLGKLLRVSPKRASTLYYRHRAQFFSQLKIEE